MGVEDVLGIWNTQSIGDYAVPGTVVYQGVSFDTRYVRWVLYEDGQCTLTQDVDGAIATFDACEYTVDLDRETISIVFQLDTWDGSIRGKTITLTDPQDIVWVLRAQ